MNPVHWSGFATHSNTCSKYTERARFVWTGLVFCHTSSRLTRVLSTPRCASSRDISRTRLEILHSLRARNSQGIKSLLVSITPHQYLDRAVKDNRYRFATRTWCWTVKRIGELCERLCISSKSSDCIKFAKQDISLLLYQNFGLTHSE